MRAARSLGLAALLASAACVPDSEPASRRDADGDGIWDAHDCAPSDPSAWYEEPLFVDSDRDGRGVGAAADVCRGTAAPAGFAARAGDCDDSDPVAFDVHEGHADDDGDGFGAGPWLALCAGASPPRMLSVESGDCAPDDAGRWIELAYLHRDADLDGVTVAREGLVCSGPALPPGYATVASGVDCDDADGAVWLTMEGYADVDHDGAGAGARVSLCTPGALPDGWAAAASDCAPDDPARRLEWLYAYRDADLDGRTVPQAGALCLGDGAPPAGYLQVGSGSDCDDANDRIWELRSAMRDTDRDGFGAGEIVAVCSGAALPDGWVTPWQTPDCAPDDAGAWQKWSYTYRDADGDGRTVASSGTLCIGSAPPAGYGNAVRGDDCDDTNAATWVVVGGYLDADLDGVGAGARILTCTDGTLPAGQLATGNDCASDDGSRWRLLSYALADADGDGWTAPVTPGQVCAGAALPDPWRAAATGRDCDDSDAAVHRAIVRYLDGDADGVGATPRKIFCVATDEPAGYSRFGWDVDDGDAAVQWDGADADLLLDVL